MGQAPSRSPLQHSTLRIIKWTAKYFAAAVDRLKFCHVCKGAAAAGGVAVPIKRGGEEGVGRFHFVYKVFAARLNSISSERKNVLKY